VLGDSSAVSDAVDAVFELDWAGGDAVCHVAVLRLGLFWALAVCAAARDGKREETVKDIKKKARGKFNERKNGWGFLVVLGDALSRL
jgi:hypothetical protein